MYEHTHDETSIHSFLLLCVMDVLLLFTSFYMLSVIRINLYIVKNIYKHSATDVYLFLRVLRIRPGSNRFLGRRRLLLLLLLL